VAGIAFALVGAGLALHLAGSALSVDVALDWLPGVYLLAGYWLPAQLPRRPSPWLQSRLEATDRVLFQSGLAGFLDRAPRLFLEYLEATYLCCYVTVPAGLAWLYLAGHRREADAFWTAVLVAAFPSYMLVAWFETRPPRSVEAPALTRPRRLTLRRLNFGILDRASNGVNTFPSGHVAASFAAALSVGAVMPAAGALLGVVAVSIAVASVAGRYHYVLDAVFGVLAATAAFAISRFV
jgi:membrane-associated phospholipid phosphatase